MKYLRREREAGFTLIELLVVIAVITVLASLLLPGLAKARQSAHSVKCKSNLRQIALALRMYVDETDQYPTFRLTVYLWPFLKTQIPGQFIANRHPYWFDMLERYGAGAWTNTLFNCPDYKGLTALPDFEPPFLPLGSYGYNAAAGVRFRFDFGSAPTSVIPEPAVRESSVLVPSDMIALGDANLRWDLSLDPIQLPRYGLSDKAVNKKIAYGIGETTKGTYRPPPGYLSKERKGEDRQAELRAIHKRHGGRQNISFCDGHVESIKYEKLFELSDGALRRWNINHEPIPD